MKMPSVCLFEGLLGRGGQFRIRAQNVGRNWSEGKIERALGYSRRYLADFRWGRFNFDTDVERTKETLIGRPNERARERATTRQEIAVQDEH